MLLSNLIDALHIDYNQLQVQIEALQAKQRQVLEEIQGAGVRESRMESCLALLQEVIRESQGRPEELEIFKSAVDAAFSGGDVVGLLPSVDEPTNGAEEVPTEPQPSEEDNSVEVSVVEIVEDSSRSDMGLDAEEAEGKPVPVQDRLRLLPVAKLRALARSHRLIPNGTKEVLVERLRAIVTVSEILELSA